jgi:hypothetical protein
MLDSYESYVLFLAIKRHFTRKDYDCIKYHFKVKTSVSAFEARNDRYFFQKLAKHEDPKGFLLAACTRDDPNKLFIGSLIRDNRYEKIYQDWRKTRDAIEYMFEQEVAALQRSDFVVNQGSHPRIIDLYFKKKVSIETLSILERETKILRYWNRTISDTLLFPDVSFKIQKYAPFLRYKKDEIRKVLDAVDTK